jgi:predicted O-methyltransferase YrrM
MEFLPEAIDHYAGRWTEPSGELLDRIERETWQEVLMPRMLSGHQQGRFLSLVSHLMRPKRILEIGTYTGYSALCLAEGMDPDGELHTVDINEELETRVRGYFQASGRGNSLHLHIGAALDLLQTEAWAAGPWDLVFIDADKENYRAYFDAVIDRVRPGGLVIADNVLWSGKVADPAETDSETEGLRAYVAHTHHDPRVVHHLLPLRDGLSISRRL